MVLICVLCLHPVLLFASVFLGLSLFRFFELQKACKKLRIAISWYSTMRPWTCAWFGLEDSSRTYHSFRVSRVRSAEDQKLVLIEKSWIYQVGQTIDFGVVEVVRTMYLPALLYRTSVYLSTW